MTTIYVDSCGAWGTVAGGFVANVLLGGLGKSYGLIKEAYQELFDCGAAPLLLAGGLIYTLMYCNAILVHYASQRFGRRKIVLVGAFGSFFSLILAAFTTNIILWVVAIGVGVGTSFSCVYFSIFSVVGQCFRKYIGMANGVSVAGVSIGQMAFPALITYLDQEYGTRLSTTIAGVCCLHLLITAVLMPVRVANRDEDEGDEGGKEPAVVENDDKSRVRRRRFPWLRRRKPAGAKKEVDSEIGGSVAYTRQETTETVTGDGHPVDASPMLPKVVAGGGDGRVSRPADEVDLVYVAPLAIDLQPPALTKTLLAIYVMAKIFADVGDVSVSFIAPSHGNKLGFSKELVSFGITLSGLFDLVARLGIGWLIDRPCCTGRRGILLAVVWLVEGVNALGFSWLNYFTTPNVIGQDPSSGLRIAYFFCFAVHGVTSGTAVTLMIVVLTDWVGKEKMSYSLAITLVVLGIFISPGQYLMGYLADRTNQYVVSLQLCSFILVLAGFLVFLEFPARFYFARRGRRSTSSTSPGPKNLSGAIVPGSDKQVWEVIRSDVETTTRGDEVEHKSSSLDGVVTGNGRHSGGMGAAGDIV